MASTGLYILETALEYFFKHCPDPRGQTMLELDDWEEGCEEANEILADLWLPNTPEAVT